MFKDILVPVVQGDISDAALRTASRLAEANRGHVVALVGVSMITPNAAWDYYPEGVFTTLKESADAAISALAEKLETRLARGTASYEIRRCASPWLTATEMALISARYSDLVVMGRGDKFADADRQLFAGLLTGSGRPLLLVPEAGPAADAFERILIAWKPTREATRAVHDAMPLLRDGRTIDTLMVDDEHDRWPNDEAAGQALHRHLQRHDIATRLQLRESGDRSNGECILDYAAESNAQLVVAGGYSRSRAMEQVFGGVTRTLFERAPVPVLFSH
jgi:nucleotide-binding universal stress UspA family protein